MKLYDKVAAITGAGSGIGRATALRLAEEGVHLALSDIDAQGLRETAHLLCGLPVEVSTEVVDVADRVAVEGWAQRTVSRHGRVNIVINNAGVVVNATVDALPAEDFAWLMNINFWGVVNGTQAFLPWLKQAEEGLVVNISSVFGLIGVPTQSAYNASKFAVRGFSESLAQELDIAQSPIRCCCVHPGGIRTAIVRNSRTRSNSSYFGTAGDAAALFDRVARTSVEQAARTLVDGILRDQRRILIGADAKLIDLAQRLMPVLYQKMLTGLIRRRLRGTRHIVNQTP
jgi:NAD(P)-dependent dehydrogenase (short-subunit alcohol dehydrogenase family)